MPPQSTVTLGAGSHDTGAGELSTVVAVAMNGVVVGCTVEPVEVVAGRWSRRSRRSFSLFFVMTTA